jgi:hypothetical protein
MAKAKAPPESDILQRLVDAVDRLANEVQVMRQVIDEIRDDFAWGLNNDAFRQAPRRTVPPMVLKSMPLDPRAPDFGRRINQYRQEAETPDADEEDLPEEPRNSQSGQLF